MKIRLPKLNSGKYRYEDSAKANNVFLIEYVQERGATWPIKGWKIVGWIDAPYPSYCSVTKKPYPGFVFERTDEDCQYSGFAQGDQIWQHYFCSRMDENFELLSAKPVDKTKKTRKMGEQLRTRKRPSSFKK